MAEPQSPLAVFLRELASLMLQVARESVTVIKRSAPELALKLKRKQEWDIYIEFLKVMFNLIDRVSAFHLPIQEQPRFMDSLVDAVAKQLHAALTPILGSDGDEMEVVISVGNAVIESRQLYERFRFVVTEESKSKDEFFRLFGERIAQKMGASQNELVISSATLCASAVIPAIKAVFEGLHGDAPLSVEPTVASAEGPELPRAATGAKAGQEITLISVMSTAEGEEVETRWGLHPRFKQDLKPDEVQELTRLMNRVTRILGERYAAVAFSSDWATWHRIGHA